MGKKGVMRDSGPVYRPVFGVLEELFCKYIFGLHHVFVTAS